MNANANCVRESITKGINRSSNMPSTVEQLQRRRERFELRGLCKLCGKESPFKHHKLGRNCLRKSSDQKSKAREAALVLGKCQECRVKPTEGDSKHCSDCLRRARGRAATRSTLCETCGGQTGRKRAKFCDDHRPTRNKGRKYKADQRTAELIREVYSKGTAARGSQTGRKSFLTELAQKLGWPYWAVQSEARRLGVTRIKERNWSKAELEILERNAHWTPTTIRKRLKEQGYSRSIAAIEVKRYRLSLFKSKEYLSAYDLAINCFRVCPDVVTRWIKRGWLRAMERKDVDRSDRTYYWIKPEWVYEFVLKHPLVFDLRKVDQVWFIDLLTEGKAGLSLREMPDPQAPSITEMERNEFGG